MKRKIKTENGFPIKANPVVMMTMRVKIIHQENGLSIYKDDYNYFVVNHGGYILKSSKTIYPCLKFMREKKYED